MNKTIRYLLVVSWAVAILLLLVLPVENPGENIYPYTDKILHAGIFGIWSLLIMSALVYDSRLGKGGLKPRLAIGFIAGSLYAGLTEFIQLAMPARNASFSDFLSDILGIIIFLSISYARYKNRFA